MKVFATLLAMLLATGMNNVAIANTDPPLVTVDDDKNPDEGSPISKNKAVIGAVIVGAVVIAALGGRALAKRMKGSIKKVAGASDQGAPNHRASTEGGNGSKGNTDTVANADPDVKPQDVEPQVANKPETTEVDNPTDDLEVTEEATNTVADAEPQVTKEATDSSEVTEEFDKKNAEYIGGLVGKARKGNKAEEKVSDTVADADPPVTKEPKTANVTEGATDTTVADAEPQVTKEATDSSEVTEEFDKKNADYIGGLVGKARKGNKAEEKVSDTVADAEHQKVESSPNRQSEDRLTEQTRLIQEQMAKGLEAHPETIQALEDVGKLVDLSPEDARKLEDFVDETLEYKDAAEYAKDVTYIRGLVERASEEEILSLSKKLDLTELVAEVDALHEKLLKNPSDMGLQIDFYKKEDILRKIASTPSMDRSYSNDIAYNARDYMEKIYMESPIVRVVQVRMDVILTSKRLSTFEHLDAYEEVIDSKLRKILLKHLSEIKAYKETVGANFTAARYIPGMHTGYHEELATGMQPR